jgi:hypothetical protein
MVTKFLASSMRSSVSSPESSSSRQPLTSPLPTTTSGPWSPDVTESKEGQNQPLRAAECGSGSAFRAAEFVPDVQFTFILF